MNLTQLKFVIATAQLESFSKAADLCNVTQPTLSNGVAKLERQLAGKIFERTTRKVSLSSFGQALLPTIESILKQEQLLYLQAREFSNPETLVFKIGMSPLLNANLVSLLTSAYKNLNSGVEILLIEDNLNQLEDKLKNNQLDLILIPIIHSRADKSSIFLYEEALFYIENQQNNNAADIQIADIANDTFVMVPDSCGLSEITRSLIRTSRLDIIEYEGKAMSYQVLADWASNGLGSAILPKSKIAAHINKQKIYNESKPAIIQFQAKWVPGEKQPVQKMIEYFRKNAPQIISGIA
ncbi:MAG: LysR family transcriptional regulator [Oceanospirillaceae bacterium]|nr:LysR family transcriptional regulator [Oceanospirillaceae bacterium]